MHPTLQHLVNALRDWTCLGSGRDDAAQSEAHPTQIAWLAWVGIPAGCLVAGFYYPPARIFLPPDVVLAAALCVQAFLLSFHAEAGMAALSSSRATMPRGPGAVTLAIILKLVLYRQFFPEEVARLLFLGTAVSFAGPALLTVSLRQRIPSPPLSALIPMVAVAAAVAGLAARSPSSLPPAGRAMTIGIGVLACVSLARIVCAAFIRERRAKPEGVLLFAASLPCEIAAIGGYLLLRFT